MALGVRDPGYLPNVLARIEKTRRLLEKPDLDPDLRQVVEGILAFGTTQHEHNKRIYEGTKGLPFPHADSHIPGADDPLPVGVPSGLANESLEGSALAFVRQDHQHKRDVRGKAEGVDVAIRNALDFRANTLIGWGITDDPANDELDVFAEPTVAFTMAPRGGTVLNPTIAQNVIVWYAPYTATVMNVRGYMVGGVLTGTFINARKNGTDDHLASNLELTSFDTWIDGGAVQNAGYLVGDKMEIMIAGVSAPRPDQVAIQIDLVRT